MPDSDISEIYKRLVSIEKQLATMTGMLTEREKTCTARHLSLDTVCTAITELKGAWKMLAIIAALVGGVAGSATGYFLGRHI